MECRRGPINAAFGGIVNTQKNTEENRKINDFSKARAFCCFVPGNEIFPPNSGRVQLQFKVSVLLRRREKESETFRVCRNFNASNQYLFLSPLRNLPGTFLSINSSKKLVATDSSLVGFQITKLILLHRKPKLNSILSSDALCKQINKHRQRFFTPLSFAFHSDLR
jgi:hypothetical protein